MYPEKLKQPSFSQPPFRTAKRTPHIIELPQSLPSECSITRPQRSWVILSHRQDDGRRYRRGSRQGTDPEDHGGDALKQASHGGRGIFHVRGAASALMRLPLLLLLLLLLLLYSWYPYKFYKPIALSLTCMTIEQWASTTLVYFCSS